MFPTAGHLASWAGLSPGSNESAGRTKSTKTRPGNRYLKGALGIAALTAARSKNTYFSAKYKRIATRRGPMRAIVAVEHAIVIAAFNLLTNGDFYRDPGPDYYTARQPARTRARAIIQLQTLGYRVTFEPLSQTAITQDTNQSAAVVTLFSCQRGPSPPYRLVDADRHLGGLDENRCGHPGGQAEVLRGVFGDRCRHDLLAAVEAHLDGCHYCAEIHLGNGPAQLISRG